MGAEMVTEGISGPATTAVQGVADHTAPARIGRIDPDIQLVLRDGVIQIEIADPRLHQGPGIGFIHLQHAVHAFQIQHD